jgi:hypothetical protein
MCFRGIDVVARCFVRYVLAGLDVFGGGVIGQLLVDEDGDPVDDG